ncbi:MAG: ABC transporter ATP-binding protein, partial [Bacilli bacterium]|nr:ABC transporter ATP-binding protein [Bacilli bacterium]MCI5669967.1 ABC transporter ATP-binding protein [Bacilli bacterium]MDD7181400.1 ABC transporter ATP-binding protein [Bacilli bacterium]MDD7181682.1 ABC transporter ATP-binding protein [Bacilli bacterium]
MPRILLEDVTKRWNDFYGADHLDMEIEDKGFITLLGPSGCGKTTTLR